MSASLVGSEMCIRDSLPPLDPAIGASTPLEVPIRGVRGAKPPREARSVSYTHLTLPTICSV
eukprot:9558615-Alexandrium_andersonii.AAC.1